MKKTYWIFALTLPLLLFVFLSWKNPYSDRTTIGNFDPFPDSMHYVVPARNFIMGHGFRLWRPEGESYIAVPPIYSLSLIPAYLINLDPSSFYFSNLALSIASLIILFFICKKLSQSSWATGLILLLYAGTYVVYWQPSIAMAENVLLPILLTCIYLWLQPLSLKNTFLISAFAVFCYGSKYVSLPLTISILGLQFIRLISRKQNLVRQLSILCLTACIGMILVNGKQLVTNTGNIIKAKQHDPIAQTKTTWFSPKFIPNSLPKYAGALIGQPIYNLFSTRPILPPYLAVIVLSWCVYAIIKLPKYRSISIYIVCLTASQLAFLSLIQMVEGRYAFVFLPLIYTGLAAMLGWLIETVKPKELYQILAIGIIALVFAFVNYKEWKLQLIINFKAAETPWWQIGIVEADKWLVAENKSNPIVVSGLNPFLWDFYRQSRNYQLLPLSEPQDFTNAPIWGTPIGGDWWQYYRDQSKKGRDIYVSTVGFNPDQWKIFEKLQQQFPMVLINQDCNNSCRLYRITP